MIAAAVYYGTRYTNVRGVSARYITAEITCGEYSGNILFILRIPLSPTDAGLPFTLCRRQTQRVGVLLDKPVFTHGQLYVVSSRCGDPSNIRFL